MGYACAALAGLLIMAGLERVGSGKREWVTPGAFMTCVGIALTIISYDLLVTR